MQSKVGPILIGIAYLALVVSLLSIAASGLLILLAIHNIGGCLERSLA